MDVEHNTIPTAIGATPRVLVLGQNTLAVPSPNIVGHGAAAQAVTYTAVPFTFKAFETCVPWRVQLKFGRPTSDTVLGLDIYSDIVFGRGKTGSQAPDIDLTELDALEKGVSRRHALLRPAQTKLFIMDLGSTNGISVNAVPVGRGYAKALETGDIIRLGALAFVIDIVSAPPKPVGLP